MPCNAVLPGLGLPGLTQRCKNDLYRRFGTNFDEDVRQSFTMRLAYCSFTQNQNE